NERARATPGRPRRRGGRLRPPRRALPARAARTLLPNARLGARRRGRPPGSAARGVEGIDALRGAQLAALLALHDHDERLPEGDSAPPETSAAGRLRAGLRPPRPPRRTAHRVGLGRSLP